MWHLEYLGSEHVCIQASLCRLPVCAKIRSDTCLKACFADVRMATPVHPSTRPRPFQPPAKTRPALLAETTLRLIGKNPFQIFLADPGGSAPSFYCFTVLARDNLPRGFNLPSFSTEKHGCSPSLNNSQRESGPSRHLSSNCLGPESPRFLS